MKQTEHRTPGAIPPLETLAAERWPRNVAVAWVLSRDQEFAHACARSDAPYVVEAEAVTWRRAGKPAMLFPTPDTALERLCKVLELDVSTTDFLRSDVVAHFPADSGHLLETVWRGDDPREHHRIRLSHAAWWLASDYGSKPFVLDDRQAWARGFDILLPKIVEGRVSVMQIGAPPASPLDGKIFDQVPLEAPCRASETWGGSLYRPGYHTFVACDLLDPRGDRYFERGSSEPKWQGLVVLSDELLDCFKARNTRQKEACSSSKYEKHWNHVVKTTRVWPSETDDDKWAKTSGYSVESVRNRRKQHIDKLPAVQREHVRKGGRRKPFPKT